MTNYREILRLSNLGLKTEYKMPDYEYVAHEMQKNGVTLNLLWLEYCEQCRNNGELPYQLTHFKKYYRDYTAKNSAIRVSVGNCTAPP